MDDRRFATRAGPGHHEARSAEVVCVEQVYLIEQADLRGFRPPRP
jgi:hypothetical protein